MFFSKPCVDSHRCSFVLVLLEALILLQITSYSNFKSCTYELNLR
jgi:hypothetical protein